MTPKITVGMATSRDLGMFPLQVDYLKNQTFKDFELVFFDDLYEQRKDAVRKEVGDSFPLIYLPPREIKPVFAPGAVWNDLFTHCSGELLFFMADYIVPHQDCLRVHWETHLKYPKTMISGRCWEMDITAEEFIQPNKVFHYNDYRLSLYENSYFRWSRMEENIYGSERAGVQNFWTGRNDSAPMEVILQCNGFDEQIDGARGYHDEDLAQRMAILGLEYIINLQALCWQFPHTTGGGKPSIRSDYEQHQFVKMRLIPERIAKGIYRANPHRDVRKEREKCLKQ